MVVGDTQRTDSAVASLAYVDRRKSERTLPKKRIAYVSKYPYMASISNAPAATRQGSQYFRRAKSRREYAARGFRFSLFRLNSKWEERELKGNLGRRIVARWHAFSPGRNAEMPAVGRVSPANSRRRSAARGYRLCSFDGHPAERHPFCPKADRYQRAEAPSRFDAGSQTLNACATCR